MPALVVCQISWGHITLKADIYEAIESYLFCHANQISSRIVILQATKGLLRKN